MSGGVDSSVAAALCVQRGDGVFGIMLRLWAEPGPLGENRCCAPSAVDDAAGVARTLGIAFQVIDARDVFASEVVDPFVASSAAGDTPNPCLDCNRRVRFGFLLEQALALGADALVTGHYARVVRAEAGDWQLLRGADPAKDQSYVLSVLGQDQLARVVFPLGSMTKAQVRAVAAELGLAVADRKDSVDLCWVGEGGASGFLERRLPADALRPGPIVDPEGRVLGRHAGLARYTVGQRRGLGMSGGQARFVVAKDLERNALVVGAARDLEATTVQVRNWHWVSGAPAGPAPWRVTAQTRYRAPAAAAWLQPSGGQRMTAEFDAPQRAPAPGQALVAYDGDVCLGGGPVVGADAG
jgi:tRNA-specific 2-thiouridylase